MTEEEVDSLPPESFLRWQTFVTPGDTEAAGRERYAAGLEIGANAQLFIISAQSIWSARMKDGTARLTTEAIGTTPNTAALLHGILDSGVQIVVHRSVGGATFESLIR